MTKTTITQQDIIEAAYDAQIEARLCRPIVDNMYNRSDFDGMDTLKDIIKLAETEEANLIKMVGGGSIK